VPLDDKPERQKSLRTRSPSLNAASMNSYPANIRQGLLSSLTRADAKILNERTGWWLRPEQTAPSGSWRIWLLLGGRGAGKTLAGAHWLASNIWAGRMRRVGLIGATHHDARSVMVEGESGLLKLCKDVTYEPTNRRITFPTGATVSVLSADEPDSLRGPQFDGLWLDELGCPAVDKGANEPNVFVDPKSAESALPYYSNGERDDLIQRRFLEAHLAFWSDAANNPASLHYAGRMVDTDNIYVWCWDARPFPFFPARADIWGDSANYTLGHWLNGRLGTVALSDLVGAICDESDFAERDISDLDGLVTGYALTSTMSARDALTPLSVAFHFDAVESEGDIVFPMRGRALAPALGEGELVLSEGAANFGFALERAQETDLPLASRILYIDADADYRQASVEARRLVSLSDRVAQSTLPIVMDQAQAGGIAQRLLQDGWVMRETAKFALPPSRLALDVADDVVLTAGGRAHRLRLTAIDDGASRQIEAVATDPSLYEPLTGASRAPGMLQTLALVGRALVVFLDLPLLTGDEKDWAPHAAAFASPWPGSVQILKSASSANYVLDTALSRPSAIGQTTADFAAGPLWCWDQTNSLNINLAQGTLASTDDLSVLGGANVIAVQNAAGDWEIVQFANVVLTAPGRWTLSRLLRGQAGSENAMGALAGARVVVLDGAMSQLALQTSEATLPFNYLWGPNGKAISDPAFQGGAYQFKANGRRPYAPCRLRAVYAANGIDLALSWIRRDRAPSADSWDQTEIALSETSESYDVEILSASGAVVRTFASLASAACTYTAAQMTSDFPSGLPSPFRFNVYQLSTTYGRGPAATASVVLH
jgi:hypothetical protein